MTFDLFNGMRLFIRFLYSFSFGAFRKCAELIKWRGKKMFELLSFGRFKSNMSGDIHKEQAFEQI